MQFIRCLDGSFTRVFSGDMMTTYSIVPAELVSNKKIYTNTPDNIFFNNLGEEFPMGEDVLVFPDDRAEGKQLQVLKGKVIGYT